MSGEASWLSLHIPSGSGLPPLLVSPQFGPSAYRVHLTDLTSIWAESLDRKAICMRAWKEETSIDPSDTSENMQQFLSCLHSALDQSHPSHESTTLRLSTDTANKQSDGGLVLRFDCELPGLPDLKWLMYLEKCPSATISSELVLPLLRTQNARIKEKQQLVDIIKEKDHVISRLSDKLEGAGIGLENVFTGLAVKRKITRAVAGEKVRGLAPFRLSEWNVTSTESMDKHAQEDIGQLVHTIFADGGLHYQPTQAKDEEEAVRDWWKGMAEEIRLNPKREATISAQIAERPKTLSPARIAKDDDDDSDFQVQSTPPHINTSHKTSNSYSSPARQSPDPDKTADENGPPSSPRQAIPKAVRPQESRREASSKLGTLGTLGVKSKLGALGGKGKAALPLSGTKPVVVSTHDNSETASETASSAGGSDHDLDENKDVKAIRPAPRQKAANSISPRQLPREPPREPTATRTRSPSVVKTDDGHSTTQSKTTSRKLGRLGGKGVANLKEGGFAEDGSERGRTREPEMKASTPVPRETSVERANRRREQLKMDRDAQLAQPAKKKRRF